MSIIAAVFTAMDQVRQRAVRRHDEDDQRRRDGQRRVTERTDDET